MLISMATTIASLVGIIGFFLDIPAMLYIGGVMYVIETANGLISGELHNLNTTIITLIISVSISLFCNYNILHGICFGLSIENFLLSGVGLLFMLFYRKK